MISRKTIVVPFLISVACLMVHYSSHAQRPVTYIPPGASAQTLIGVPISLGQVVGKQFTDRFSECDHQNTCDGKLQKFGCAKDPNQNTVILRLPGGTILFDAKMGLDLDGSPLSSQNAGPTDQPNTSFRFPNSGSSVNSNATPYVVIPLGGFDRALGVSLGDIAAVIYKNRLAFALVADFGPKCKLGEGSIRLHEDLGHSVCKHRNSKNDCMQVDDLGISKDVLYLVFPNSAKSISAGLSPENVNKRLSVEGSKLLVALKTQSK